MATKEASAVPGADFLSSLLREREVSGRAALIARRALELVGAGAAVVYTPEDDDEQWRSRAALGEVQVDTAVTPTQGSTLAVVIEDRRPRVFAGAQLAAYTHSPLQVRRTPQALAYLPLFEDDSRLIGILELISFDGLLDERKLAPLSGLAEVAAPALAGALAHERERNQNLRSIDRLTQLYDLEKTFNAKLEMDVLLPLVSAKFREMLNAQAVHIWMVRGENELELMSSNGYDATVHAGAVQLSGEGIATEAADSGEPVLIDSPEDSRLATRNAGVEEGAVFSAMTAPLVALDTAVGAAEAINKLDGTPFDDADLFLLTAMCDTAANALHNASLLLTERKLEILQTLVSVSSEITSTLHLDRVLQAVVNSPGKVIPYHRAAIALEQRGRCQLKAVSGTELSASAPQFRSLRELLEWAAGLGEEIFVRERNGVVDSPREETRLKFESYFKETGMRGFFATPLADDQGMVGMLSFESSDPEFIGEAHLEMIRVLAAQATVAVRNASLYQQVPLIGVLEPLLQTKRQLLGARRHRARVLAVAAAALAGMLLIPVPMRVGGDAVVHAGTVVQVQPAVEGVLGRVLVREGQPVSRGQVLGELEDWNYRAGLTAAQARYQAALATMNRALATSDAGEAGIQRAQVDYWAAEVSRAGERLARTRLRSPIDGQVTTPHIETLSGEHLNPGQTFAEIVDTSRASVDVTIDQDEVNLLRAGQGAAVKLETYPSGTFRGRVDVISPTSYLQGDERYFYARLDVANRDGLIRPGMQGRAKISVGAHPLGYVWFRHPVLWLYAKVWSWFGW